MPRSKILSRRMETLNKHKTKVLLLNRQSSLITKHKSITNKDVYRRERINIYLSFYMFRLHQKKPGFQSNITAKTKTQTYLKLYDSLVKHILLYACESLADSLKIDTNIKHLLLKNKLEKVPDNLS